MTPEEIKRLRDVCDSATIGPWVNTMHGSNVVVETSINRHWITEYNDPEDFNDAQFIACARTAMPLLLDEIEALQNVVKIRGNAVEQLQAQNKEREITNQKLNTELVQLVDENVQLVQLVQLVNENARLRHALEKIAYPVDENTQQVALEALERGK